MGRNSPEGQRQLRQLLSSLAASLGIELVEDDGVSQLLLSRRGGFTSRITVPLSIFEWFVDVTDEESQQEVWDDWADYFGETAEKHLAREMEDIRAYVEAWMSAGDVRVVAIRPPRRRLLIFVDPGGWELEWEHGGYWSPVEMIWPQSAPPALGQ